MLDLASLILNQHDQNILMLCTVPACSSPSSANEGTDKAISFTRAARKSKRGQLFQRHQAEMKVGMTKG